MKKFKVDQSFLRNNSELVKELGLKIGDVLGYNSAEDVHHELPAEGDPIKEDPRKPPIKP